MSLLPPIAHLLELENQKRPITGDILTIGWQYQHEKEFHAFDGGKVNSLDVSDFEGATIIHDLNEPLPPKYYNIADFIFDGGCLDNIFNPAQALRSYVQMLRPGGRLITFSLATMVHGAYAVLSPEWHWDYFEANKFSGIRLFVCPFIYGLADFDVFPWKPGDFKPTSNFLVVAMADKASDSTDNVWPVQENYRVLHARGQQPMWPKQMIKAGFEKLGFRVSRIQRHPR